MEAKRVRNKKPFDAVLYLDDMSHISKSLLKPKYFSLPDDEDEEDETGRPLSNIWKGENYPLPVLGHFKNDFEKNVKRFQSPAKVPLTMNTFCHIATNSTASDPCISHAYLVWESPGWKGVFEKQAQAPKMKTSHLSDSEEEGEGAGAGAGGGDSSEPEPELLSYMNQQKERKRKGEDLAGETLYYDEEHDVVRNLHQSSFSLTSYVGEGGDGALFGKALTLFDQLSPEEQKMIQVEREDGGKNLAEEGDGDGRCK